MINETPDDLTILIPEEMLVIAASHTNAREGTALQIKKETADAKVRQHWNRLYAYVGETMGFGVGALCLLFSWWYSWYFLLAIFPMVLGYEILVKMTLRFVLWINASQWGDQKRTKKEQAFFIDPLNQLVAMVVRAVRAFNALVAGWRVTDFSNEVGLVSEEDGVSDGVSEEEQEKRATMRVQFSQILHLTDLLVQYRQAKELAPADQLNLADTIGQLLNAILRLHAEIEVGVDDTVGLLPREEALIESAQKALKRFGALSQKNKL